MSKWVRVHRAEREREKEKRSIVWVVNKNNVKKEHERKFQSWRKKILIDEVKIPPHDSSELPCDFDLRSNIPQGLES